MSVHTYITLKWHSPRLAWNRADYGNRSRLIVSTQHIWTPHLQAYNHDITTTDNQFCTANACEVTAAGHVACYLPCVQYFSCVGQLTSWPFDRQRCAMTIGTDAVQTSAFPLRLWFERPLDAEQRYSRDRRWRLVEWRTENGNGSSLAFEMQLVRQTAKQLLVFGGPVAGELGISAHGDD